MIIFKLFKAELEELSSSIPNFEVILNALLNHPKIDLVVDDDGWADCFTTQM